MAKLTVSVETSHFKGSMARPNADSSPIEFDVVTGLQLPDSVPLRFEHYLLPGEGQSVDNLILPKKKALRLADFALRHFVEGRGNFDCRAFTGYVMGWHEDVVGTELTYWGYNTDPDQTKQGKPYIVISKEQNATPHAFIGHTPGKGFGVAGYEFPLVIADNAPLMHGFGGQILKEVAEVEFPPAG